MWWGWQSNTCTIPLIYGYDIEIDQRRPFQCQYNLTGPTDVKTIRHLACMPVKRPEIKPLRAKLLPSTNARHFTTSVIFFCWFTQFSICVDLIRSDSEWLLTIGNECSSIFICTDMMVEGWTGNRLLSVVKQCDSLLLQTNSADWIVVAYELIYNKFLVRLLKGNEWTIRTSLNVTLKKIDDSSDMVTMNWPRSPFRLRRFCRQHRSTRMVTFLGCWLGLDS